MQPTEKVAIIDCGGQYTKVIDRRVRELEVYCDIFPATVLAQDLAGYHAIILSGGPQSIWEEDALHCDKALLSLGVPMLGICYGMHWMNVALGGTVSPSIRQEYGVSTIDVEPACPLFDGLAPQQTVLMSHGDSIETLAPGMRVVATSGDLIVGFGDAARKLYAVQFHPEVDLSENGQQVLANFLRRVAGLTQRYALEDRIETALREIREQVGDRQVLVLVSGGVDSAVTAALLLKALDPDKIFAIHIDHGLMRKNESDSIIEDLKSLGLRHLVRENAQDLFFDTPITLEDGRVIGPLTTLTDPEEKRTLVGTQFVPAMARAAQTMAVNFDEAYWAQGTLRPDLIESGNPDVSSHARKIKTHHNDVDIMRKARDAGRIVETNRDWHKDEVRQIARMLGLREDIAARQPFPGPGLTVRVLCQTTFPDVPAAQQQQLAALLDGTPYCGCVLPIRSVGVQGDARSYRILAVLWGKGLDADGQELSALARKITNEMPSLNRVAYVLDGEPTPETLHCHALNISPATVDLLRDLDAEVTARLSAQPLSQSFAVLLPVGRAGRYSSVVRAIITNDFMTGRAATLGKDIALDTLRGMVRAMRATRGDQLELILYDITDKPPATIEWE